jgi:hypothetical protein
MFFEAGWFSGKQTGKAEPLSYRRRVMFRLGVKESQTPCSPTLGGEWSVERVTHLTQKATLLVVSLMICFSTMAGGAIAGDVNPPVTSDTIGFEPTWSLTAEDSFSASIGAMGLGVSISFAYSFDAGITLPVSLVVFHPQYLNVNSTAVVNVTAQGEDDARAWAYASGSFDATLNAGIAGSYSLVDKSINFGDEVRFKTPIGSQKTETIEADTLLGSQTIDLLLTSITVELRMTIVCAVTTSTSLSSHLTMSGVALSSPIERDMVWLEEDEKASVGFSVRDEEGTTVDMAFDDVTIHLHQLTFTVQSLSVYLVVNGQNAGGVTIPLPPMQFSLAEDGSSWRNDGRIQLLADVSGSSRNLGSGKVSIYVGVPFMLPAFLSPGFLLMVIPVFAGLTYGRKREHGSKAVGIILLLTVFLGSALSLGLQLSAQPSLTGFIADFTFLIIPQFSLIDGGLNLSIACIPWMLAGLAVGSASKSPRAGAALGLTIPLVMFLLAAYFVGGTQALIDLLNFDAARNAVYAGAIAAALGGVGGFLCKESS